MTRTPQESPLDAPAGTAPDAPHTAPAWDLAAVAAVSLWLAFGFIPAQIPAAEALGLSPALLPTAAALGMAVLCAAGFLLSLRPGATPLLLARMPWGPVTGVMALCVAGVVIVSYAGLAAGALFLIPTLMRLLGERRWLHCLLPALLIAALFHFVVA
ncbi:hypothetical protein [Kerstersia gyiorum]|uniref:Tripartite tricarboxylate transporter TctB family protein n=1 Tax=Kerstersia gyiorum TaxID=206506 RepID=A0A171KQK1_9BURK|nr:hypothetical protein [Kerstersia gyiorum]KKO71168.1 hypothetical protein AAV32_13005 [Kerstersia gyiorum]MCP1631699.1 hypothetical protein [Kerstersia gyiorum]MCP1636727.1 hypothetical protein [Kerstersia gyiorum]MCP1671455.1 hypothetical protein [Kerstersia gyiorum]MCP1677416.1 hypothetical protein [Kerstersia gyiorum]